MNTKLQAVTDSIGRPIRFFITASQVNDYTGARALLGNLRSADRLRVSPLVSAIRTAFRRISSVRLVP